MKKNIPLQIVSSQSLVVYLASLAEAGKKDQPAVRLDIRRDAPSQSDADAFPIRVSVTGMQGVNKNVFRVWGQIRSEHPENREAFTRLTGAPFVPEALPTLRFMQVSGDPKDQDSFVARFENEGDLGEIGIEADWDAPEEPKAAAEPAPEPEALAPAPEPSPDPASAPAKSETSPG